MFFSDEPYTFDRVFRLLASTGLIVGSLWLLNYLSDVLIPFAAAFLIAYLLNPPVNWVQRKIKNRAIAVLLTLALFLMIAAALVAVSAPLIKKEITHLSDLITEVANNTDMSEQASRYLPAGLWDHIQNAAREENVQQFMNRLSRQDLWALLQAGAQKLLPGVWSIIHGTASFIFAALGLFIIVLYVIFMLLDYEHLVGQWRMMMPASWHGPVMGFLEEFNQNMQRYFRGQALIAALVGMLFCLGFWLIGLPLAILMGLFAGLLNMVPYLQILAVLPTVVLAVVMAVETGRSIWLCLLLLLSVFALVQLIQESLLIPRIMGKVTGLSPALILLSLSIWGKMLGFLGLIIALPMTCLFLAYYNRLLAAAAHADDTNPGP
jgi:predicted PurR-regulated permease PerM